VAKEVRLLELQCHVVPHDISTLLANRSYSSYTKVEKEYENEMDKNWSLNNYEVPDWLTSESDAIVYLSP
jgi:hypothetical protein